MPRAPGRGGTVLGAIGLVALFAAAAAALTSISFGNTPVDVSRDPGTTSGTPYVWVTHVNGVGGQITHYVWREDPGGAAEQIMYRRSTNAGSTFDSALTLSIGACATTPCRGDPRVASAGDEVMVVWAEGGRVVARFSGDSGQSFPNPPRTINLSTDVESGTIDVKPTNSANPLAGSSSFFSLAWARNSDSRVRFARQFVTSSSNDTFEQDDVYDLGGGFGEILGLSHQYENQLTFNLPETTAITTTMALAQRTGVTIIELVDGFDTSTGAVFDTQIKVRDTVAVDGLAGNVPTHSNGRQAALVNEGDNIYVAWLQVGLGGETEAFFDHNNNGGGAPAQPSDNDTRTDAFRSNSVYGPDVRLTVEGDGFGAIGGITMRAIEGAERLQIVWFERSNTVDTGRIVQRSLLKPTAGGQPVDLSETGVFLPRDASPAGSQLRFNGSGFPTRSGAVAVAFVDDTGAGVNVFTVTSQTLDGIGPAISRAIFHDVDIDSAVSSGDTIHVIFSETFVLQAALSPDDFNLPVSGDDFGVNAADGANSSFVRVKLYDTQAFGAQVIGQQYRFARITLGSSDTPILTINGSFNQTSSTAGSPSGIDLSASSLSDIVDLEGNTGDLTGTGGVDIEGTITIDTASELSGGSTEEEFVPGRSGAQTCLLERALGGGPFDAALPRLRSARDAALARPAGRAVAALYYALGAALGLAAAPVLAWGTWRRTTSTRKSSSPN